MVTWTRVSASGNVTQTEGVLEWEWRSISGDEPTKWLWSSGSRLDADTLGALYDEAANSSPDSGK
jgi:hypothetical protein